MRPATFFVISLLVSLSASAQITVEAKGKQYGFANAKRVEVRDTFPERIEADSWPRCVSASGKASLPTGCMIDYSRTYSTSTGFAGGYGAGAPGYGIIVNSINTHDGGSATYTLDPINGVFTSTVEVCRKEYSTVRGWYEGVHVLYALCPDYGDWSASYGPFPIPSGGGWFKVATLPAPPGDVEAVQYTISVAGGPPLQAGLFGQHPDVSADKGLELWVKLAATNDLTVTGIEITQGIQNLANKMPLVAGRRTVARAYVHASTDNVNGAVATISAWRDNQLLGSTTAENTAPIRTAAYDRAKLDDAYWFEIPKAWRSGTVRFVVQVDSTNVIAETDETNNNAEVTVAFQPGAPVSIVGVPFHMHEGANRKGKILTYTTSDPSFPEISANLLRYHPVSDVIVYDCGVAPQEPMFHFFGREWQMDGVGQFLVLNRVNWVRALSPCGPPDAHWVGLIHPAVDTTIQAGTIGGIAIPFGRASWVRMQNVHKGASWNSNGGETLAHELGHNLGLPHVDCDGSEGFPLWHLYPYERPDCRLSKGDHSYFGFDVYHDAFGSLLPLVISNDPAAVYRGFPIMGYREPAWADPFDYCLMMNLYGIACNPFIAYPPNALMPRSDRFQPKVPATETITTSYFLAGGVYDVSTGKVEDFNVMQVSPDTLSANAARMMSEEGDENSELKVEQISETGTPLMTRLVPMPAGDQNESAIPFLAVMPRVRGANGLRVSFLGRPVVERIASSNPPAVRFVAPKTGRLRAGDVIRWAGFDPDSDPLTYTLQYSPDGKAWYPLVISTTETSFVWPPKARLPGSRAGSLRVLASDGFHTAEARIRKALILPFSPPVVTILQGRRDWRIPPGRTLVLNGSATDADQGAITDDTRFTWSSSVDGPLGTGRELSTRTLRPGQHDIRLEVSDRDGLLGVDSVFVCVCDDHR